MKSISSRLQFLAVLAQSNPHLWELIHPHQPKYSIATREYMIAGVLRDIARQMPNKDLAAKAFNIGRQMVDFASSNLLAGWEDGDDICPPLRHFPPFPFPEPDPNPWYRFDLAALNPQPLPPAEIGVALRGIAEMTSMNDLKDEINGIAKEVSANQMR